MEPNIGVDTQANDIKVFIERGDSSGCRVVYMQVCAHGDLENAYSTSTQTNQQYLYSFRICFSRSAAKSLAA